MFEASMPGDAAPVEGAQDAGELSPFQPKPLSIELVPQTGVHGLERVAFALPLPRSWLHDPEGFRVEKDGIEIPSARTVLSRWPDGSVRSVGIQIDRNLDGPLAIDVRLGVHSTAGPIRPVPFTQTLVDPNDDASGPRVWAKLPGPWLLQTQIAGPEVEEGAVYGTPFAAWNYVCNYARWGGSALSTDLATMFRYDRPTVFFRGFIRHPDLPTYIEGYRDAARYRDLLRGHGAATRIAIAGHEDDVDLYYAQGLALAYLFTGDTRYRDAAEDVADAVADLWPTAARAPDAPGWNEQKAGFALLTWVWAMVVSDDRADVYRALADDAVATWLAAQRSIAATGNDTGCFPHMGPEGYVGCSPWQSAVLAEALDTYAAERGGTEAAQARKAVIKLGRSVARDSIAAWGQPADFIAIDGTRFEPMSDDQRWGDTAYLVALAYADDGRRDRDLWSTAMDLVWSFSYQAQVEDMASFDRQCRVAPATPWYLERW